jgi:hypothetical protein
MAPEQIEVLIVLDAVGARMERGLAFAGSSQICDRSWFRASLNRQRACFEQAAGNDPGKLRESNRWAFWPSSMSWAKISGPVPV